MPNSPESTLVEQVQTILKESGNQQDFDQRLFMVSGSQYQALVDLLDRPEQSNEGLRALFARKAPWDKNWPRLSGQS